MYLSAAMWDVGLLYVGFLQRVSTAGDAQRCSSYEFLSVRL